MSKRAGECIRVRLCVCVCVFVCECVRARVIGASSARTHIDNKSK